MEETKVKTAQTSDKLVHAVIDPRPGNRHYSYCGLHLWIGHLIPGKQAKESITCERCLAVLKEK